LAVVSVWYSKTTLATSCSVCATSKLSPWKSVENVATNCYRALLHGGREGRVKRGRLQGGMDRVRRC